MVGIRRALRELTVRVPLQVQVTLDTSGRMLLGTDIAASMTIIESMRADVIGLNCSTGPEHMRPADPLPMRELGLPTSVIPNAGIPLNQAGTAIYPRS